MNEVVKAMKLTALIVLGMVAAVPAGAENVKIGFISTFSGGGAIIGKHMQDAAELALDLLDRKVGGQPTQILFGDDQQKPEIGKQVADEMVKKDRVQFVTGIIWSNVMLAVYNPVVKSETILISANAGPGEIAGKLCSPYFFSASLQNTQPPEAIGQYMHDKKIDNVFVIVPNYSAGKEDAEGFKRFFKGKIAGEIYFQLGQQDFAAEITQIRNANPSAVFVFAPGGMGIQFVKQYSQAGLKKKIPLYSVYTSDEVTLGAQREAALGNYEARHWNYDLDNAANRRFVEAFRKKYNYTPSWYAAQAFDAIMLIDSAVRATKGKTSDKKALITALRRANFQSVRGNFKFNTNQFPVQDFYLVKVVQEGGQFLTKVEGTIFRDHKDAYYAECKMK